MNSLNKINEILKKSGLQFLIFIIIINLINYTYKFQIITSNSKYENMNNLKIVNINIASLEELISIPGIRPSLAERIIRFREENGKFKKIDELKKVKGIGDIKFKTIKRYIIVK